MCALLMCVSEGRLCIIAVMRGAMKCGGFPKVQKLGLGAIPGFVARTHGGFCSLIAFHREARSAGAQCRH